MEPKQNLLRARLVVAGLLTASFLFAAYSIFFRSTSSRMSLGDCGTDHFSHANAAVLFFYRGWAVYRVPVRELLQPDTCPSAGHGTLKDWESEGNLFRLPERRKPTVPLWLNWVGLARVYPPGLYLYSAVEGLALECTEVPPAVISAFSLLKYSLVGHLCLWVLFDFLLVQYPWREKLWGVVPAWALFALLMLGVQVQVCFWALYGIYDGLALLFLLLMVICYKRQLWAHAVFFFAVGVFFHFRSLWFFPLAGLASLHLARTGLGTVLRSRRDSLLLLGSFVLLAVSGFFFCLAYPAMLAFPLDNPLSLKTLTLENLPWSRLGALALLLGILAVRRDWLLMGCVAGALFFLFNTRQVQQWHSLSLVPLLLCSRENTFAGLFRGVVAYSTLSYVFLSFPPYSPHVGYLYYFG